MSKDILIVDDEKNFCRVLNDYCSNMGCFKNIIFAQDGATASIKLKNQKFDVILMDLNLPKRSGLDVITEMSEDKRAINSLQNIIVISGSLEKDILTKLLGLGVKNFIAKPFDEATIQEKILKIIKK